MALAGICRTQVFRFFKFTRCSVNFLTDIEHNNARYLFSVDKLQCKHFCTGKKLVTPGKPADPKAEEKPKKRKPLTSPQITLIMPDEEVMAVTLEHADRLSKRRNLKLVKIIDFDTKTEKPVYKLMTALEFFEESSKMKEKKRTQKNSHEKETKLFTMSSKISDHDLQNKVRQMFKLLKKKHGIKVYIAHDGNSTKSEEIAKMIEDELTEVSTSTEHTTKGGTLKLLFKPKLQTTETTQSESDKESNNKKEDTSVSKKKALTTSVQK